VSLLFTHPPIVLAKAGTQAKRRRAPQAWAWIPAFAGMIGVWV
jgi:hypothetical protein